MLSGQQVTREAAGSGRLSALLIVATLKSLAFAQAASQELSSVFGLSYFALCLLDQLDWHPGVLHTFNDFTPEQEHPIANGRSARFAAGAGDPLLGELIDKIRNIFVDVYTD